MLRRCYGREGDWVGSFRASCHIWTWGEEFDKLKIESLVVQHARLEFVKFNDLLRNSLFIHVFRDGLKSYHQSWHLNFRDLNSTPSSGALRRYIRNWSFLKSFIWTGEFKTEGDGSRLGLLITWAAVISTKMVIQLYSIGILWCVYGVNI